MYKTDTKNEANGSIASTIAILELKIAFKIQ